MRSPRCLAAVAAWIALASPARAEEPDVALSMLTGSGVLVVGFGLGGGLLTHGSPAYDRAGWLTMEAGFTLAPLASHAVSGEWERGLAFAAVPAAGMGGTTAILAIKPNAVRHGKLGLQRVMWGLFGAGLFVGTYGVVDSTFAGERALRIAPSIDEGYVGIDVGGTL